MAPNEKAKAIWKQKSNKYITWKDIRAEKINYP